MAPRFSFERAYTAAAMLLVQIQLHVIIVCHHATENAVRPMFGPGFCWPTCRFSLDFFVKFLLLATADLSMPLAKKWLSCGHRGAYDNESNKCLANAKRPCDCLVLCLRLKSSLCSCAHSISDMTSFSCRDQGRDSVCPVL